MDYREIKEQIVHQEKLLDEYRANLEILELKEARLDYINTPPDILIDIKMCKERMQACKQKISKLKDEQKRLGEIAQREAKQQYLLQALDHVKLIEDARVSLVQRLENAQLIGENDKRVGVCTLPEHQNDQYWCGPFPTGSYPIARGKQMVQLHEFRVARYPVTIWQFHQFVNDHGYTNKRWWMKDGQPPHTSIEFLPWNIFGLYASNQPIVSVSWYEASAFCQWLTARARTMGWLSSNHEIRLPTEAEWMVAAMWDAAFKQMRTWRPPVNTYWQNVQEVEVIKNTTSPVGLFPEGASPCGALDMAGNVWEWCSSSRDAYPMQAHIIKKNVRLSSRDMVLRGGSWKEADRFSGWDARSVASLPTTRLNNRGFRVFLCARSII